MNSLGCDNFDVVIVVVVVVVKPVLRVYQDPAHHSIVHLLLVLDTVETGIAHLKGQCKKILEKKIIFIFSNGRLSYIPLDKKNLENVHRNHIF